MTKFIYEDYRELLVLAKSKYKFRSFKNFQKDESFIIMRHDICPGIGDPVKLGSIEKELSISSTYFFSLDSSFYNLLSVQVREIIQKLVLQGHEIGIHIDVNKFASDSEIMDYLSFQKEIFVNTLKINPDSFSFHNPTNETIAKFGEDYYFGMTNTYSDFFMEKVGYCSDSNGYWRYESLGELLESYKNDKLQVLIHPIWWSEKEKTPYDKVLVDLDENKDKIMERWVRNRVARGRKIIGFSEPEKKVKEYKAMSKNNIQLMKPNVGSDEIELVKQVIESGYLVEGPMVREFEKTVADYIGVKHAITCTSWTTGAELVFRAIGIEKGDEVICPDFTHPATALAVITAGGTPVFVDVDLESRNTTSEIISNAINERTKAIQPVSIFGNPVDIDPINKLSKKHNLVVIDDAACTLGSHYKGSPVGGLTDFTIFSFHPRKVFTCGDGGLITTNDDTWAEKIRSMKVFGAHNGEFINWGTNQRMSNIHGAVLLGQARRLDEIVSERIKRAKIYNNLLSDVVGVSIPEIDNSNRSNYQTYAVLLDYEVNKLSNYRREIMEFMKSKNIETQIGTYSISETPYLKNYKVVGGLYNSKLLASGLLSLPLHHELTEDDQKFVVKGLCDAINSLQ